LITAAKIGVLAEVPPDRLKLPLKYTCADVSKGKINSSNKTEWLTAILSAFAATSGTPLPINISSIRGQCAVILIRRVMFLEESGHRTLLVLGDWVNVAEAAA
jgi:hypothetical protein